MRSGNCRCTILSSLSSAVTNEVLDRGKRGEGGLHIAAAQSAHHCSSHLSAQHRVLAHRLFNARPSRIAGQIEHGAVADVPALQTYLTSNDCSCLFHKLWRPSGGHSQSGGKDGCAYGHVSVGCFFG